MKLHKLLLVTVITLCSSSGLSLAEDQPPTGLPGVKLPPPIVQEPAPEPDDEQLQTKAPNSFRVGNTDVTISGEVTIDVGTGSGPRHTPR